MTPRSRLPLLVVLAVVLQAAVFPAVRLFGVVPDVGLLLALAVAIRVGPGAGALVGFFAGAGVDLFVVTPLGLTALSYSLVAYLAGSFYTGLLRPPRWNAPWLAGFGALASGTIFVAVGIVFGVESLRYWGVFTVVLRLVAYDVVLAVPVFAFVNRVLREAPIPEAGRW
jgi:rod shape-determining protein MreD